MATALTILLCVLNLSIHIFAENEEGLMSDPKRLPLIPFTTGNISMGLPTEVELENMCISRRRVLMEKLRFREDEMNNCGMEVQKQTERIIDNMRTIAVVNYFIRSCIRAKQQQTSEFQSGSNSACYNDAVELEERFTSVTHDWTHCLATKFELNRRINQTQRLANRLGSVYQTCMTTEEVAGRPVI